MEVEMLSFPILLSFFVFMFMVLRIISKKRNEDDSRVVLPPGPWKFPIVGNLPQLLGAPAHERMRDLARKFGPVMSIQQGEIPVVVISSAEIAHEVLKNQGEVFAGRPTTRAAELLTYNFVDISYAPYGDYWRQMRKICTLEFLSVKRVQSFKPIREEEALNFIKFLESKSKSRSQVNVTTTLGDLMNTIILRATFGKNAESKANLIDQLKNVVDEIKISSVVDLFPSLKFIQYFTRRSMSRMKRSFNEMDRIIQDVMDENRAIKDRKPEANNLLDVLLDLQKNGNLLIPLTDECIKANIVEVFGTGSHTISKTIEWAMSELMRNPRTMKEAQEEARRVFSEKGVVEESRLQELKYLKSVIKETFRLHPAATFIVRESIERTKVNEYDIPPKTRILVNVWALGRDPNIWNDPAKFYPERFEDSSVDFKGANMELIPFGAGKRICPGISLASVSLELVLANLLFHFDWELPHGITPDTLDMSEVLDGTLNRKTPLCLIPIPFSHDPS